MTDEESAAESEEQPMAPAIVRRLAEQQTVTPYGAIVGERRQPADASPGKPAATAPPARIQKGWAAKKPTAASKSAHPAFSGRWFNQQLGRRWVLYPLCALTLLGALWLTILINSGKKSTPPEESVAVAFEVVPDANGLEVVEGNERLKKLEDGTYRLEPGGHALTFRKEGFQPLTKEVEVTAENNKVSVKLEPIIRFNDVVLSVTPPDANLQVGENSVTLNLGTYTHKLQEGQPLKVVASRDGYVSVLRVLTPEELISVSNKVDLQLEREKPKLPPTLVAKPGAEIDPDVQLPVRVLAAKFTTDEPLELVLVKPGTYNYGSSDEERRDSEISERTVRIEQPYYIAIHETTNAQYQRFFESEGPSRAGDRWQRSAGKWAAPLKLDPLKNHLPVTNVSPEQAQAFCNWIGGRLPTEIEWESAIRGLEDRGYPFPWGSGEPTRERCRIFDADPEHELGPVPVEKLTAGASPLGLMNAIGNAAEWCVDREQPSRFVLRGCSFATTNINDVRLTWRTPGEARGEEMTGFRVLIPASEPGGKIRPSAPETIPSRVEARPASPYWVLNLIPWETLARNLRPLR